MLLYAFIIHAEARLQKLWGEHLASDVFESYSAGTETKLQINQDAVRIMKELYGIDMEAEGQYSKLIDEIPVPDIAISMGCNVGCPFIGRPFDDNWGLEDPTGKSDEEFKKVIDAIRMQIFILKQRLDEFEETKEKANFKGTFATRILIKNLRDTIYSREKVPVPGKNCSGEESGCLKRPRRSMFEKKRHICKKK